MIATVDVRNQIQSVAPDAVITEAQIAAGLIRADYETYARPLHDPRVEKIAKNLNPLGLLGIIVSRRKDGTYWVIDGNHRINGAKKARGDGYLIRVYVIENLSIAEEAKLFDIFNAQRGAVSTAARVRALYQANDPMWLEIIDTVLHSLSLDYEFKKPNSRSMSDGRLRCWAALEHIYTNHGRNHLQRTLQFVIDAWDRDARSLSADCVRGVSEFILRHETGENPLYSDQVVVAKLNSLPFETVHKNALKRMTSGVSGPLSYVYAMAYSYNSGKKNQHLKTRTQEGHVIIRPDRKAFE